MVFNAILFYVLSILLVVASACAVAVVFKKQNKQLYPLHILYGALGFILMLILLLVLIRFAFSGDASLYMTAYFSKAFYKIGLAIIFFAIVFAARYFILNAIYYNRQEFDKGSSFFAGFGLSGGAVMIIYCFFMLISVIAAAIRSDFSQVYEGNLLFKDGTVVSAFLPLYSHLAFALFFTVYTAFCLALNEFMIKRVSHKYKPLKTFTVYTLIELCEVVIACLFVFAISKINIIVLVLVCAVFALLSILIVKYLYKYVEESNYNKQFN